MRTRGSAPCCVISEVIRATDDVVAACYWQLMMELMRMNENDAVVDNDNDVGWQFDGHSTFVQLGSGLKGSFKH